jgi:hypothetical protein
MPILVALLGLALPRVTIFFVWLFSHWFTGVFDNRLIPILGFIFLPYTLLWYTTVINWFGGNWGLWQVLLLGLAIIIDLAAVLKSRS